MGAGILSGLRIVEMSAFVAAPLGGATLAAMGADVIRVDPPGGGIDIGRWPLHRGRSLYWAGLNQGKRSVTIDMRHGPGQEKVAQLITAAGEGGGIFLTNLPVSGWNSYEELKKLRADLIMLVITGSRDGGTAVDYTVNAALGFPFITGPEDSDGPVNHVLPAWDAMTGFLASTAILAAERHRRATGEGQLVELSLSDVGLAVAGHLGFIGEAVLEDEPRGRFGNHVYGTFGRDFVTRDGRRVMVLALTPRQWRSLAEATGMSGEFRNLEARLGLYFNNEGDRWRGRQEIRARHRPIHCSPTSSIPTSARFRRRGRPCGSGRPRPCHPNPRPNLGSTRRPCFGSSVSANSKNPLIVLKHSVVNLRSTHRAQNW